MRYPHIRLGSVRFYVVLAVVILGLHTVDAVIVGLPTVEVEPDPELANAFKQKQLEVWAEMNKLLIAFATVTIGAIGGFMLNRDRSHPLTAPQRRRAAVAGFSAHFPFISGICLINRERSC